uniref:Thioredoxin domain-containing protein n=1 Tax=Salix viminalis TaxID=40686 RepID=A0A6N2LKR3_SALVM
MGKISLIIFTLAIIIPSSSSSSSCDTESDGGIGQWQILTNQNFSSQIRLHPHILLLVSVPWSGESRSLKKEITHLVNDKKEEFGSLKLMYMHKNNEKMLADAIGAVVTDEITLVFYHHSLYYKYKGKSRARNILSSIFPYLSPRPEEMPLKRLSGEGDLKMFIESADKVVLLLEFCGWTEKLIAREKNNGSKTGYGVQGEEPLAASECHWHSNMNHITTNFTLTGFDGESNVISTPRWKENQKVAGTENGEMKCGMENGLGGIPWLGEFASVNDSAPLQETDSQDSVDLKPGAVSCSLEESQKFDSFFSSFMTDVREFFLPPERHRFGLVSEKSLLSPLGVEDSGSWSVMLYYSGCPSCSRILKEGDDMKRVLQMEKSIVTELEGDGQDLDSAIPSNKPSVLLFVDRSSDLSETRRRSKAVLDVFRELALHYNINQMVSNDKSEASSVQASTEYQSVSGHPKLKLSPTAQNIKSKDKMSIMIVNDGKPVMLNSMASGLEGSSLHEILTYLLQKKEEAKLSSVAKEAGFQLLSDDFNIKVTDTLPSVAEAESKQVLSDESLVRTSADLDKDSASNNCEGSQSTTSQDDEEKSTYSDANHKPPISEDARAEKKGSFQADKLGEEQLNFQNFKGSFFFCDGNYRLLSALTGETRIPSLVLIDPLSQQHYVFPEYTNLSYSSLEDFLHGFLNGNLIPYQRSESEPESPREETHPPFVNMDFHEADSIPQVTAHTFSEQRMELIVREVHRSIKGFVNMLKTGSRTGETVITDGNLKKLPKIFLMDCTLNDCSLILKSMNQREVYPTLLLFPAERKNTVCYEGGMAVADVITFLADRGSNSQHLASENGILWTVAGKKGANFLKDALTAAEDKSHEVLLKNLPPKRNVEYGQTKSHTSKGLHHDTASQVAVGSILVATEKLNTQPFDKSRILIIKSDQNTGFQGLIYNKHMRWDTLQELEEESKLLKEAPLSFGGPLVTRGMPLVALTRRAVGSQYPEVAPGTYFLGQSATLHEIEEIRSGNQRVSDYWFFLGFSSWGWDQLFDEIAQGAWNLSEEHEKELLDWPWLY